jgi:hypothetical protein
MGFPYSILSALENLPGLAEADSSHLPISGAFWSGVLPFSSLIAPAQMRKPIDILKSIDQLRSAAPASAVFSNATACVSDSNKPDPVGFRRSADVSILAAIGYGR